MTSRRKRLLGQAAVVVLIIGAYWMSQRWRAGEPVAPELDPPGISGSGGVSDSSSSRESAERDRPVAADSEAIERAFRSGSSGVMVEASGTVSRVLSDDNEGSRHQRFIFRSPSGHTVLVAHNIDLAPRVPLDQGDAVELRGQYEWNDRGGVVHWTHRDPRGRHPGGWIRHRGRDYE